MPHPKVVIVTGSTGFIGSALINKLAGGYALVGFDRIASRSPPPAAECVCIDLRSDEGVAGAFAPVHIAYGERIASVVHLAVLRSLRRAEPALRADHGARHGAAAGTS
jgi:nucleoside-diphosphate-sugar epimerase